MQFESPTIGIVTLEETFTAFQEDLGSGVLALTLGGDGVFDVSDPGFSFEYTDLEVVLQSDVIDGSGLSRLDESGSETTSSWNFNGFGSIWNGSFASGVGVVEFTGFGGFTVDSHEITWSVGTIPAPGATALLAIGGLARRRRR